MPLYRAPRFGLVHGRATCWSCKQSTPVVAILLDHCESRWEEDEPWEVEDGHVLLRRATQISTFASGFIKTQAPWFDLMESATAQETYWANSCTQCGALQGDWYLDEPEAAFFPEISEHEVALSLKWFPTQIEADANGAQAAWMECLAERFRVF